MRCARRHARLGVDLAIVRVISDLGSFAVLFPRRLNANPRTLGSRRPGQGEPVPRKAEVLVVREIILKAILPSGLEVASLPRKAPPS